MQIKINLKIFIFIVIFLVTRQIEIYGLLMLFAFFHELGHLFSGLILGFKPQALSINPLGISINFKVNIDDYNRKVNKANMLALKKIIIALSGPAVNFIIAVLYAFGEVSFFGISNEIIVFSNILIGLFNLIPIYPLDGGRVLKSTIHIFKGIEDSYTYTNLVSNACIIVLTMFSSIGIFYLKNIAIFLIIIYLWYLVINENKQYNQRIKINKIISEYKIKIEENV